MSGFKTISCRVCAKQTLQKQGWHLKNGLDFCSNACVAKFIESAFPRKYKQKKHYIEPTKFSNGLIGCKIDGAMGCSHEINDDCECVCHEEGGLK